MPTPRRSFRYSVAPCQGASPDRYTVKRYPSMATAERRVFAYALIRTSSGRFYSSMQVAFNPSERGRLTAFGQRRFYTSVFFAQC